VPRFERAVLSSNQNGKPAVPPRQSDISFVALKRKSFLSRRPILHIFSI